MNAEKVTVALKSVIAAVFLTITKLIVGVITGSLGIISEAIHSALDLVAAIVTYFAVKISDKPADERHTFGHGKVESISALIEAVLLLITCIWIIYEATERLISRNYIVEVTIASFAVMILSIVINISRYTSLNNAAKKYNSQALRADALHFISDVYSSIVVVIGLVFTYFGYGFADSIAALGVSILVLTATYRLAKDTIEVLLDTAPEGAIEKVRSLVQSVDGVIACDKVRVRTVGPSLFIDINIGLNKYENYRDIHRIIYLIKERLTLHFPNSDISICTFPVDDKNIQANDDIFFNVKRVCYETKGVKNSHNIKVFNVNNKKHISMHVEVDNNISLEESHNLVHRLKETIIKRLDNIEDVSVSLQHCQNVHLDVEDVTESSREIAETITSIVDSIVLNSSCHNIKIYKQGDTYTVFLHCKIDNATNVQESRNMLSTISSTIKEKVNSVEDIHIHFEPNEQK